MENDFFKEINRLFLARVESVEKMFELSREDAAKLLQQVFERATTLEVLAVLYKEYGFSAMVEDPATRRRREEEARLAEEARRAQEYARQAEDEARRAAERARQAEAEARRLKEAEEKARRTDEEAQRLKERNRQAEAKARQQAEEARQLEEAQQAEAESLRAEEEAQRAEEAARQATENLQMMEQIQASPDLSELEAIFDAAAAGSAVQEAAAQRLAGLFQEMVRRAGSLRELESLAQQLPPQLDKASQADLISQLSRCWEDLLGPKVDAARNIDELSGLTKWVISFWQICDERDWPLTSAQRAYAGIIVKWLQLLANVEDLHGVELPSLTLSINEESRPILTENTLRQEVNRSWEAFLKERLAAAQSLQALKQLYYCQNWDEYYSQAKKLILSDWNQLTEEALQGRSSFAAIGQVVRQGGSQIAIHRWIDEAVSWEHVTEIYAFVESDSHRSPHYSPLVEKILAFADTEEKIRQAQSLLRSHALSWLMGDKTMPGEKPV